MKQNIYYLEDERNILFAKKPNDEDQPFEYIYLHDDENENEKFIVRFDSSLNKLEHINFNSLYNSSELRSNWASFFTKSAAASKNKQTYYAQIEGFKWKKVSIAGFLSDIILNRFDELRNNIIKQNSKDETV